MKLLSQTLFAVAFLAAVLSPAQAAVMLTFDNGSASPQNVEIQPGDSFSFDIFLTSSSEQITGLTYFLQVSTMGDPGNPGSGLMSLSNRTVTGTPFSELQTSNTTFLSAANAVLDPENARDAGGIEPDLIAQPAGTYFVATLTIQSSPSLPVGTYTLNFSNAIYINETFDPAGFDSLGSYTVAVVPEPSMAGLIGLAGILTLRSRRKRRQAN